MSTLAFNMLYTLGGVGLLIIGSRLTQGFVGKRMGRFNRESMDRTAGLGVVPRWVSLVVLVAWFIVGTGVLSVLAAFFTGE
ncbi:MAG TPA: hypothetical protein VFD59_04590 [Nocardioidaceae bacterium]|nr:hypothetical protein [Nocardioidaceae bacterium]